METIVSQHICHFLFILLKICHFFNVMDNIFPVVFWYMACHLLPYLYVHTTVWAWESSSWSNFQLTHWRSCLHTPQHWATCLTRFCTKKVFFVMSQLSSHVYVSITLSSRKAVKFAEPLVQGNFPSFLCGNSFIIDLVLSVPLTRQFQWFKH